MRRRPEKLLMAILVKGEKFHRWNISSEFKNVLNISRVWQIAFRYRFEAFHAATCVERMSTFQMADKGMKRGSMLFVNSYVSCWNFGEFEICHYFK